MQMRFWPVVGVFLAMPVSLAWADGVQDQAFRGWKVEDQCTRDAVTKFPDHNAAALKNRDDFVDTCLKAHGRPPRARPVEAPAPAPAPAQ